MRCLLCPSEIDETKSFDAVIKGPNGPVDDVVGRLRLAQELERWTQVTLTAQVGGGCRTLQSGHVCPDHDLEDVAVGLVAR